MSRYEIPWPWFTLNENVMIVGFGVLGIEPPDIGRLISYRLNRPLRNKEAINNQMNRINNGQLQRGYPILCTVGMADWDKTAVDDYLIRMTDDVNLLERLLWFDNRHLPLLKEYEGYPIHEIVDVRGMQRELGNLLGKHHVYWSNRSLYGRRNFY